MGRTVDTIKSGRKTHGFLYVFSGESTFSPKEGKKIRVSDGDLLYIPKGKKYKMQYTRPNTIFVVVNFNLQDKNGNEISLFDDFTLIGKDDSTKKFAKLMAKFEICSASQNLVGDFRRKELLYRLLSIIYNNNDMFFEETQYPQISKGVILLKQTYLENLPITRYAEASHVSVNTFRSAFQKEFGTSPLKYRNRLRVERAKELLSESGFTVAEAAYASGFENIGYFCRYYRQVTGESPDETKRKYNEK
jgi:AraC-like DNA-binding protein